MIELYAVGGYLEVGRNMTAIKYKDEVIIIDMGLHLENYILKTQDEDAPSISSDELIEAGALPQIELIKDLKSKVKAIVASHAHLDHIGAIPFLAGRFSCPILCTTFTGAVLEEIMRDNDRKIPNKIRVISDNASYHISDNFRVEFVNITHSVPDSVFVAIHTPEGTILYTNDFKFDDTPTLGKKPNYEKIQEFQHVKLLILDSLYASKEDATPSEAIAKDMLQGLIYEYKNKKNALIITTFSSHIARLKGIVAASKTIGREPVFFGRSLAKYAFAAQTAGIARLPDEVELVKYSAKARKKFVHMQKERQKYVIVCTGHQGEKKATLSKMVFKDYFQFKPDDCVIFSSSIIPNEENIRLRKELENALKAKKVRVITDIHVSGHAHQYDHKKIIEMLKPENVIPGHCTKNNAERMKANIAKWSPKTKTLIVKEGDYVKI